MFRLNTLNATAKTSAVTFFEAEHLKEVPSDWQDFKVVFVLSSTGKLLNALLTGLSDRSASVRKSYATAIGHLVKVHSDKPYILPAVF